MHTSSDVIGKIFRSRVEKHARDVANRPPAVGRSAIDVRSKSFAQEPPLFPTRLQTSAHRVELVRDGDREWAIRIGMIERARAHVFVSTYYLEQDDHATEFLAKLIEAAKRGVEVRLAYDSFAQKLASSSATDRQRGEQRAMVTELGRAGAVVTEWRARRRRQRLLGAGNHVKVQLSEAGEVLFGSSNISRRSIREWNELSALMTGPITDLLRAWFLSVTGCPSPRPTPVAPSGDDRRFEFIWCHPALDQPRLWPLVMAPNPITELLIEAVERAQREVWITSFYFKPTPALRRAILSAARRGVDVNVVHSHRDALFESDFPWLGAAAGYQEILDAGVRVFERETGEHSKVVVVDDDWGTFGTYNLEHAAHDRLAEAMLVTTHVPLVMQLKAEVRASASQAVRVDPHVWTAVPTALRIKVMASRGVQRWL